MNILLEIAYLGKDFHGWQVQPGCRTVQGVLQNAYENLCGLSCRLTGCSRTDAGRSREAVLLQREKRDGARNPDRKARFCNEQGAAPPILP